MSCRQGRPAKVILRMLVLLGALLLWPALIIRADGITHLAPSDGLLNPTIHSLGMAPDGRLLIGTSGGLNIWDGLRFGSHSAGNGLAEGRITAVSHWGELLLAGSWGGGVSMWNGQDWQPWPADGAAGGPRWISALASDSRNFWVGSYGEGLVRQREDMVSQLTRANSALASDYITCLAVDPQGLLWIGTERQGLQSLDAESMTWRSYALPNNLAEVTALCPQNGYLWVGTRQGLARLDSVSGAWTFWGRQQGLTEPHITALAAMPDGTLAIGTYTGLAWHRGGSLSLQEQGPLAFRAISAMTLDVQGQLWIGTLTDGLYVQSDLAPPDPARLPVVLVHGWQGPDSDLMEDSEFWHLARWLREDGFVPYYAQGISPEQTLHQNAERLAQVIAQARQDSGADQVYIIAFSMGGLNTRAYLESTLFGNNVAHVFILGTPHRGEHLWLPFLAWEAVAWSDEPSAVELWPVHQDLMALLETPNPTVPYTLIAGDAQAELLPTLFRELPPSDGLVSTWSALDLAGGNVTYRLTPDIHAWSADTLVLDLPTLLLPRATYDAHIRPILFGVAGQTAPGQSVDSTTYPRPRSQPQSAWRIGAIQPGQTLQLAEVPVEQSQRIRVHVRWQGEPLTVTLRTPDGRWIDHEDAADRDDVEYLALDFADYVGYVLTDTMPGDWGIVLQADQDAPRASEYMAYVTFGESLALEGTTDQPWYDVGETITLSAHLTGATLDKIIAGMEAVIIGPDGRSRRVSLRRDSADAGYSAQLTAEQSGYHLVMLSATGQQAGGVFERGAMIMFGVRSVAAAIDLPLRQLCGTAQRGFEVPLNVTQPGAFLISLGMRGGDGQTRRIAHPVMLAAGQHQVFVPWAGDQACLDGAQVTDLRLAEINGPALLIDQTFNPSVIARTEKP